mmetsp:Transcript_60238/g.127604  ORF Transcript_60238/g.127604 Transcript_60238/m.127604 type:complete len:388 (-) Transcript_60238:246-1409(-)|eukprot:CAMPEP_0206456952 /NCGR_PEP_ID=MMETSP0324_2-20121206/22670_1 /ASSEMBLY_ACC=CAM_ASM_000836 /TAXON_ID=2866 /ORGANISM="Crypthecodinium cohnii, Strain Seligo" /LENGTH=387 /DNA_ID=CAMNT_0053927977 /DNA_START=52 /DNA_END=1215 /DNA_ORIENTATION=-
MFPDPPADADLEGAGFAPSEPSLQADAPILQQLQERLRLVEAKELGREAMERKRSAKMLFAGAVSGLLGFLFALTIGIIREQTFGKRDALGNPFPSGRGYFPETVSEMVHDPTRPEGKCFFAFCFVGALFIFFSNYPMLLRNVYTGDDIKGCFGISWPTYRQYVPAPGMMLLSIVTVTPQAQADTLDQICVALHLVGASMLFIGYFICEAHTIAWRCCRSKVKHRVLETKHGLRQRRICLWLIAVFYLSFLIFEVLLSIGEPFYGPDDGDEWGTLPGVKGKTLVDTATLKVKLLKVGSYSCEVLSGLSLIASHLVIWYHCEERLYDLPEELDQLKSRLNLVPNRKARDLERNRTLLDGDSSDSAEESGPESGDSEGHSEGSQGRLVE